MGFVEGTLHAPDNQVWVCGACGKASRTKYGFDEAGNRCASYGWDESCMMNATLCWRRQKGAAWLAVDCAEEPCPRCNPLLSDPDGQAHVRCVLR
jgi:hypothetical protein